MHVNIFELFFFVRSSFLIYLLVYLLVTFSYLLVLCVFIVNLFSLYGASICFSQPLHSIKCHPLIFTESIRNIFCFISKWISVLSYQSVKGLMCLVFLTIVLINEIYFAVLVHVNY